MTVNALAIDLGSTACKACVVGLDGSVLGAGLVAIVTTVAPGGIATQDAEAVWSAAVTACQSALTAAGRSAASAVDVIGITTQWASLVPVGPTGLPVGPMLMWFDRRGRHIAEAIADEPGNIDRWTDVHGFVPGSMGSLGHLLWMQSQPDLHARTVAYLEPMDYLGARLTGVIGASPNSVMPVGLTDHRQLGNTYWSDDLIARSGVDRTRLPTIGRSMTALGTIASEAAELLGLAPSAKVVRGCNDSIAACFGAGAIEPRHAVVMIGTTGVLAVHQRTRSVDNERLIVTMPSALDDRYYVVAEAGLAGKLIESASLASGIDFEDLLAAADRSTPGAGGVMFLPWAAGSAAPAPDGRHRGALVGLSPSTSPGDVARAMLEGIALQLRWLADEVERVGETPLESIRFVGGGAQSALWAAILADALGRPIDQLANPRHANARGAALMALVATGHRSLDEIATTVPVLARHEPDPANVALFSDRLGVFRDLHRLIAEPVARLRNPTTGA